MSERARYWALAASTFISTRIITGSAFLAFIASTITCLMLHRDAREQGTVPPPAHAPTCAKYPSHLGRCLCLMEPE